MGLDLYHYKATMAPQSVGEGSYFKADEFDLEALDGLGFRRYLQTIPDIDYPTRIVIASNQATIDQLLIKSIWYFEDVVATLVGRLRDLVERVAEVEVHYGLDCSRRLIGFNNNWIDLQGVHRGSWPGREAEWFQNKWGLSAAIQKELDQHPPAPGTTVQQYVEMIYPKQTSFLGLYAEEISYQRNGMTRGFRERFGNPFLCWRREDVERAASFVDPGHAERFRQDFLDNFEVGRSLFGGS